MNKKGQIYHKFDKNDSIIP